MKIAIDVNPLKNEKIISHRVRGIGFYIKNLLQALNKYYPQNRYLTFFRSQELPNDIDLVHYPYFEPFFLTLPLRQNQKTVVTVHDLTPLVFPEHFPIGIKGKIKWEIQKIALRKAAAIITDSENSKKDLIKFTGISVEKIFVVYLAAGEEFVKLETRNKQSFSSNWKLETREKYNLPEKFVLYVGDVTWNKNLPRLIRLMEQVDLPLVMVGQALVNDNYDKTNLWNQDLMKLQKLVEGNEKIIRLGFVETNDLVRIYNLAEVLIMPSLYEGFGLPVLEAMSCGCPVIAGNTGSLPEVVGEAGILVDPNKTEEIGDNLLRLFKLSGEKREEMIKKGLAQAKKFSWEKCAGETIKIYQKVEIN